MASDPSANVDRARQKQGGQAAHYNNMATHNAAGLQHGVAYTGCAQTAFPAGYMEQNNGPQHSKKRGYDDYANNFFEDAKRSRVEPVYNQAMAQRLTGLSSYLNDGWNYVDQDYTSSLPALKSKQDLLEIDQWLYQLSSDVQQTTYPPQAYRASGYAPQSTLYPNVPNILQADYSQSLNMSGSMYPSFNSAYVQQMPMYNNTMLAPQAGALYMEPRRTIDISQLQTAPSAAQESSVRDTPVVQSGSKSPVNKTEEITRHVEQMTIADEKAATEEKEKHTAMIRTMREAIRSMIKRIEVDGQGFHGLSLAADTSNTPAAVSAQG